MLVGSQWGYRMSVRGRSVEVRGVGGISGWYRVSGVSGGWTSVGVCGSQ